MTGKPPARKTDNPAYASWRGRKSSENSPWRKWRGPQKRVRKTRSK